MDSFRNSDSLVKIIPLGVLNNLLNRKYVPHTQFLPYSLSHPNPLHLHPKRTLTPRQPGRTHPQHGAVLEHVALVTDHTVLVQHGDPLLSELNGLDRTTQRNHEGKVTRDLKTHLKLKYFYNGWHLGSYLH